MADILEKVAAKLGTTKDTLTKIVAGVVAIVVILVIGKVLFAGNPSCAKPFEAYAKALGKNDAKKYTKTFPKDLVDYLEDGKGVDDFEDYYEDVIDKRVDSLEDEYGDDVKVTYKVVGKIKYTKDELDDLQDNLEDSDDDFDLEIQKAYKLALKITRKGDDEKSVDFATADVVKIKGKWVRLSELY